MSALINDFNRLGKQIVVQFGYFIVGRIKISKTNNEI